MLVRALHDSSELVVRGRVELPTFRFSGWLPRRLIGQSISQHAERNCGSATMVGQFPEVTDKPISQESRSHEDTATQRLRDVDRHPVGQPGQPMEALLRAAAWCPMVRYQLPQEVPVLVEVCRPN